MRVLKFLWRKEFLQILRNKSLRPLILVMPIMQLLILPLAANYEVRHIQLAVLDQDRSQLSRRLVDKLTATGYFTLVDEPRDYAQGMQALDADAADLLLQIPSGFARGLMREGQQQVFVGVNAVNGMKAGIGAGYLNNILRDFNAQVRAEWAGVLPPDGQASSMALIRLLPRNWYNPYLEYSQFMVPGILAMLVSMLVTYLSALNIVREKEVGTIEQINVTPVRKYQFILGKLVPFWVIGMFVFTLGLTVAVLVYGIRPLGSVLLLYLFLSVYLLAVLGLGLLVSTFAQTQQQAMFIAFFFVMIFTLMGGLFTPLDSMPFWARQLARLNPVSYFIEVMRMVVLRGAGLSDILPSLLTVGGFALLLNSWAVWNYRKTS